MTADPHTRDASRQPVIDRLLASREALMAAAAAGIDAARALSALADDAVRALSAEAGAGPRAPWAVIALGGYGAGRLLPASDFDLLIACDALPARVRPFAEAVFYPLWDSGLPVGHQVRSRKEHARACLDDTATLTASLTGRVVAGDEAFGHALLADVAARAHRARKRVLPRLAERPRPLSPYLLEPDLKEGAGGQRDLDELAWTAAVHSGAPRADHEPLLGLGLLTAEEDARLGDAAEALATARWLLHLTRRRQRDVLSLDDAEEMPADLGALTGALADVAFTLARVRRRVSGAARELLGTPEVLFAALARGPVALPALEEAAWDGRLDALVPGIGAMMTVRRPGLGHRLTVGAHCLATAVTVADAGTADGVALAGSVSLADRRPLLAAALTHDAGKVAPGPGHAARGVPAALAVARALGLDASAPDVALLVREHLLIPETAAREDVGDEDVVLRAAAKVGRRDLVAPLHLLSIADALATGPGLMTPWRGALMSSLAARLDDALSPDVEGAGIAERGESTRARALDMLADGDSRQRSFVLRAPLRYLVGTPPELVALHADLAAPLAGSRDLSAAGVHITAGDIPATWDVTVATLDRPGLFATLAGVFSLSGLSILGAEAVAGPGGTAIDVFTVQSATLAPADTTTWAAFERTLRAALGGKLDLETRLAERLRHYPPARDAEPRVTFDTHGSYATAVHVRAADRVGLLHDVAAGLAGSGLDIRSATVVTHSGMASDTFHVVDGAGDPPRDTEALATLGERLRRAALGQ